MYMMWFSSTWRMHVFASGLVVCRKRDRARVLLKTNCVFV